MSAPAHRRAKKQIITFILTIEGQEMIVSYRPDWTEDVGHFEFRSPHEPARRILVSETGYRSHFAPMEEVALYARPKDYVADLVCSWIRSRRRRADDDHTQISVF